MAHEVLSVAQMRAADALTIAAGTSGLKLMERAGLAVMSAALEMLRCNANVVVLCGPGNNGGDGFVAARLLHEKNIRVRLFLHGDAAQLSDDARANAERWEPLGKTEPLLGPNGSIREAAQSAVGEADLVIDALFGAGLSRPLSPAIIALFGTQRTAVKRPQVLAVDVPSGIDGTTGQIVGDHAIQADRTITFFRRKRGHLLFPGRALCGELLLADIGISDEIFADHPPSPGANQVDTVTGTQGDRLDHDVELNHGQAAHELYTSRSQDAHKYQHGHAVVMSGPAGRTGAARLAARGALRAGAGLTTLLSPSCAMAENAAHLTAIMLRSCDSADDLVTVLADTRITSCVLGPGRGVNDQTCELVLAALAAEHVQLVLDADALTSFAAGDREAELFQAIQARSSRTDPRFAPTVVLTPHEGEFSRLFPDLTGDKIERARRAAQRTGAVVVLKGADTVIATPGQNRDETAKPPLVRINANAPPWHATAGSGDVLAGFIAAAMARGADAFEAACVGVWLHGACAQTFGPGLIAEDIPEQVPSVLRSLMDPEADDLADQIPYRKVTVDEESGANVMSS